MAAAKMVLLPTLFLYLVLLMVPSHCKVDPTSTTPSISQESSIVCGTTTSLFKYRRLQCPKFPKLANSTAAEPSLLNILPGACVPDDTFCSYGVYSDSGYTCGGSGVICKNSDAGTRKSFQFCRAVREWLQGISGSIWDTVWKWWLAYGITCAEYCTVFILCFLCIWLCYRFCFCLSYGYCSWLYYLCGCTREDSVGHFGYDEIMTISNNFHTPLFEETFSNVFKGDSNEIPVAVKCFKTDQVLQSNRAFNAELQTLSKIHHQYVISLFGCCTENNRQTLVFELMQQGNLDFLLHPSSLEDVSEIYSSWRMRVTVLLQVAIGIGYLHLHAEPRIIHRNITAKNILIDDHWVPRISNFGMAVLGPDPGSDYVQLEEVVGTDGYTDPECNADNPRATPQNDVYSFGVVMLEVVTGRRAIDENSVKLVDSVAATFNSGQWKDIFDIRLAVPEEHEWAVSTVAKLASWCVRVPGSNRPDIGSVVTELIVALALFDPPEA